MSTPDPTAEEDITVSIDTTPSTPDHEFPTELHQQLIKSAEDANSAHISSYYRYTAHLLNTFRLLDRLHSVNADEFKDELDENVATDRKTRIAINASFGMNILLFFLKIWASIESGSLTVIASTLDSALDLLSGAIIFITAWAMARQDLYKYPAGSSRLEPLGIIVFSSSMFTATIQILQISVQTLLAGNGDYLTIDVPSLIVIAVTIATKLLLWLFCKNIDNESVLALANDHRNDVLSNTLGIISMILAMQFAWQIDASVSLVASIYIMGTWAATGWEQIRSLSGRTASPLLLKQLTYLVWNHDSRVLQIDTVRAFGFGIGFLVEVDIILPAEMSLREAHDIGEALQSKLERVDLVDRAFVHLDFEGDHQPEHRDSPKLVKLRE